MIKKDKHIEIVRSSSKGLSSMSQESCDAIHAVLSKYFIEVGVSIINNLSDLEALLLKRPDLVFLGMELIPINSSLGITDSNKIWISDFLDSHNIIYTGSNRLAHELGRNKPMAKQRVIEAGLKSSDYCVIEQGTPLGAQNINLGFPLFVKPANRGGGLGIDSNSVVINQEQLTMKVASITTDLKSDALIEEYLTGREFSVAILRNDYEPSYQVMPIELVAPFDEKGSRLLSRIVKSSNTEQALKVKDTAVRSVVCDLALSAFSAIGARDYGRVDIRMDEAGNPHFLEINLIPSLISGYGSFPKATLLNIGLDYEPMIMQITELAFQRETKEVHHMSLDQKSDDMSLPPTEVVLGAV